MKNLLLMDSGMFSLWPRKAKLKFFSSLKKKVISGKLWFKDWATKIQEISLLTKITQTMQLYTV